MLIPSIDLLGGRIVQLVQGEKLRLAFDDFEYWIEKFAKFPLVQLIDLDAAMRQGDNSALVEQIAKRLPVQAGGGIHSIERARQVLDAGAKRVIIGSALFSAEGAVNTDFAAELAAAVGAEHVVAGIDTKNGRIAVKGWKAQVELTPDDAIPQLEPYAAAFLYTHVDGEGLMQGFPIETAARLRKLTQRAADCGRRHSQPAGSGCAGCAGRRCSGGDGGVYGLARGVTKQRVSESGCGFRTLNATARLRQLHPQARKLAGQQELFRRWFSDLRFEKQPQVLRLRPPCAIANGGLRSG